MGLNPSFSSPSTRSPLLLRHSTTTGISTDYRMCFPVWSSNAHHIMRALKDCHLQLLTRCTPAANACLSLIPQFQLHRSHDLIIIMYRVNDTLHLQRLSPSDVLFTTAILSNQLTEHTGSSRMSNITTHNKKLQ